MNSILSSALTPEDAEIIFHILTPKQETAYEYADRASAQLMLDAQTFPCCAIQAELNASVDVRGA